MSGYQHISHGFDPVFDERSRILVLGSFPSVLSRKNAFYYGNPQNRFWRVMAACLGEPVPPNEDANVTLEESIAAKKRLLASHGIALWDVIESCDIKGSSDASIKNVVPAQVERVLEAAHIGAVVCNGGTAGRLYKRYLQWQVGLAAHVLPSTSPANASWRLDRLTERWQAELAPLLAAAGAGTLGEAPSPSSIKRSFVTAKAPAGKDRENKGIEYATVRVAAPVASSWSVRKSMQGNKRANTKPELLVRERLRAAGLGGYRLQWKVPGHPDIAWPGKRVAIEVRGCFWHRCPHCNPSTPKKNVEYWQAKFARNVERDEENLRQLTDMGWRVHVVWECQLKKRTINDTMAKLLPELASELGKELRLQPVTDSAKSNGRIAGDARGASSTAADGTAAIRHVERAAGKPQPPRSNAGDTLPANHATKPGADPEPKTMQGTSASVAASNPAAAKQPAQSHFMYVLECADGSLYTGYTTDVEARVAAHRAGRGAKYTRGRGPLNLLAVAEFPTKHDAMGAEYRFKRLSRDQKDALLAKAAEPRANFANILKENLGMQS